VLPGDMAGDAAGNAPDLVERVAYGTLEHMHDGIQVLKEESGGKDNT
jgi:hypothetical protein